MLTEQQKYEKAVSKQALKTAQKRLFKACPGSVEHTEALLALDQLYYTIRSDELGSCFSG